MGIPQKMKSVTGITVKGVDLYSVTDLVARLKQGNDVLLEIPLQVVGSNKALMPITREDAENFNEKKALEIQILWTDETGMPGHTPKKGASVDEIIGGVYGD